VKKTLRFRNLRIEELIFKDREKISRYGDQTRKKRALIAGLKSESNKQDGI
jgi:hypothetical protein